MTVRRRAIDCLEENTALALVGGRVSGCERSSILAHLEACDQCRVFASMVMADPDVGAPHVTRIGRFELLDPIGAGGMGVVYRARDPELDREVAIKLIHHEDRGPVSRARLLREAQAMARIQHPNVIRVYEVGAVGDQVFLAMELVDGDTLDLWCERARAGRAEIIRVFVEAGRGLAAAHAAGLIHRDFKPRNVLVDRAGRAYVTDFGLARVASLPIGASETGGQKSWLDATITADGVRPGTPAYMAPEQAAGAPATAASDQYSFCLALAQTLHAAAPGGAGEHRAIPRRLRRILARGVAHDPMQRWPSMESLLTALAQTGASRKRAAVAAALGGLALGALIVAAMTPELPADAAACAAEGNADIDRIWNDGQRRLVRRRLAHTAGADVAIATIDRTASQWKRLHRQACDATFVHGSQSQELLGQRKACLRQRLGELEAVLSVLTEIDDDRGNRGLLVESFSSIEDCTDDRVARAYAQSARAIPAGKLAQVMRGLNRARALIGTGRLDEGGRTLSEVLVELDRLGHRPLLAEALYLQARILLQHDAYADLEAALARGLVAAEAAGIEPLRHRIWILLALSRVDRGEHAGARFALEQARAILARMDDPPRLRARFLDAEAIILRRSGDRDAAVTSARAALALIPADDPERERVRRRFALALLAAGNLDEALLQAEQARDRIEQLLGVDSGEAADASYTLGRVHDQAGRPAQARVAFERALAIRRRTLGPDALLTANAETTLAEACVATGDAAKAVALYRHALAVREAHVGADSGSLVFELSGLGGALERSGQRDEARTVWERAVRLCAPRSCPPFPLEMARLGLQRLDSVLVSR